MKVCDITHFYTTKSGGVKTYLLNKVDFFGKNIDSDIKHFLILPSDADRFERNQKSNFYFIKSPEIPLFKPYRGIINRSRVRQIIENEKPDIVEVGSPYVIPSWIESFKNEFGYKTIGFYHADIERTWTSIAKICGHSNKLVSLIREYIKRTYQYMDLVITPSTYAEKYLNNLGLSNTKTVYLGLDSRMFDINRMDLEIREKYAIEKHRIVLLFVGRFSKEKRIFTLLSIYNKLSRLNPRKYHLLLVGGGPEEEKILNTQIDNITIIPYCTDKNRLACIYNMADIFVTASDSETFGLSLLEAQSCGLPVVAFKKTSIPEIVYNCNFLAETEDDFVRKIEYVSSILSSKLRNDIREFSIKSFSWEKTFKNLISIYYELYEKPSNVNNYKLRKDIFKKFSLNKLLLEKNIKL